MLEPKKCHICGTEFIPIRSNIRTCCNPECKKLARKELQRAWYTKNYLSVRKQKREYMRKVRAADKLPGPHERKPDTIVAIGYAERQMAKTLAMVSPIETKL